MKSNRILGLVLLVVLLAGAAVAWQVLGADQVPVLENTPAPQSEVDAKAGAHVTSGGADGSASVAVATETEAERDAVKAPDPSVANLPAIIGQVVDAGGQGVAGVAIQCTPGFEFDAFDLGDVDPFDPQAVMRRMGGDAKDQVDGQTDAEGRFRVRQEGTSKTIRLRVMARGNLLIERTVQRPADRDLDVGVLQLELGAVVSGRVVDANGKPVVGAQVMRINATETDRPAGLDFTFPGSEMMAGMRNGASSVTDDAGRFELRHVESGEFGIRASHANYPSAVRSGLSVAQGHTLGDVLITMPRSATIRGMVSDLPAETTSLRVMATQKRQRSNEATGGVMDMLGDVSGLLGDMGLAFGERQCEIASDGSFVLQGLNADSSYQLWVAQQGRGFAGSGVCSQRVDAATDSTGVALRYEQGVSVTFVVVDQKSGAPIERLWVRDQLRGGGGFGDMMAFAPSNAQQKPYPDGKVTIANLRPKQEQKLQLTLDAIGFGRLERKDIELPETGNLDLGTLRLDPKPVLQVTVLNAYTSRPVSDASVSLSAEAAGGGMQRFAAMAMGRANPSSARTDADGLCTLNAPDEAVAVLKVTRSGFAPTSITVSRQGSAEQQAAVQAQTVRLIQGGTVVVTVRDPDQNPVPNVNVEHRTPEGATDRRRTDANGVVPFANLTPDVHEFRSAAARGAQGLARQFGGGSRGDDAGEPWQSIEVEDQETGELALSKSPTSTLTGIVRENGVPLADATVTFRKGQDVGSGSPFDEAALGAMMGMMDRGGSNRDQSDEDGKYSLTDLPSGDHSLRITHKGRVMPYTMAVTLRDGDNQFDIDLSMTTLLGVVVDGNGNPVVGAEVTVAQKSDGGGGEAQQATRMMAGMMGGMGLGGSKQTTNGQGEFELRGVAADVDLEVRVTAKALSPVTEQTSVALGQTKGPIKLTMRPAGRIEVTIAKAQMFAALQAKFVGADAESVEPVMQVVRGKTGTLDGLRPGTWEVTFLSMGSRDPATAPKQTVNVVAGETASIEF